MKLGYGDLAADASKMDVPKVISQEKMDGPTAGSLPLKDPSQFRYIGKEGTNIVDGFDITTGRAKYGQDVRLPGMKYAVIARPPVMGGKVASFDATDTKKVPGVVQIVEIPAPSYPMAFQPSGGIAVVADNTWAAIQGRKALKIEWDDGPHGTYDSVAYRTALETTARQPGKVAAQPRRLRRRFCGRGQESRGRILHPPPRACDDGAACGDLPDCRRQG